MWRLKPNMCKRIALREATAAEFSAVALQSYKQKMKSLRSSAISAGKRNEEFVRSLRATQKQVHETSFRLKNDQSTSNALLEQEKTRYHRKIEQIYPAWQEQLQRLRVQVLRELEDKKRAVERRRYLAKKVRMLAAHWTGLKFDFVLCERLTLLLSIWM
ncbi:hypothetical protein BBJ28_00000559 [Nothophytophthora sp. Chile5]|nr:hypothetical protein BBJ28_00000559 [Nothophytophthora sp. Chile5]